MTIRAVIEHRLFRPGVGAAVAMLVGWILWTTALGEKWVNASYDYSFVLGTRGVTNKVVLILMDNAAYADPKLGQTRGQPWSRALHATLLNKLADDDCPLVVFDVFFKSPGDPDADQKLASAMGRLKRVAMASKQITEESQPGLRTTLLQLPLALLLNAARTNWGVAYLEPDLDLVVRHHWPFPSPGKFWSLPWRAAHLAGAKLSPIPQERWLRYYGFDGIWTSLSYGIALNKPPGYFRNKLVFIGNKPETLLPDKEEDKFRTPFTQWTGEARGGLDIMSTSFLNLVNGDWLRRMNGFTEGLMLAVIGAFVGAGLGRFHRWMSVAVAAGIALVFFLGGILLSYFTNYWFPWLIVVAGQIPCALAWALVPLKMPTKAASAPGKTIVLSFPEEKPPEVPEYELFNPPFGKGGFGKVWLARNAIGQWQAVKVVYRANFGEDSRPYDAEFNGIQKYKPISEKHPGLLRVELVSRKKNEGFFYYVMELGDGLTPGWEKQPETYRPRDLESLRKQAGDRRLPLADCIRIGIALTNALDFLHRQGLTHRDIKPSNVIFASGQPKLADVGLVTDIRPAELVNTIVGTLGYMPPPPERPGTAQADIYALGMLLYVISSGRDPALFPDVSTTLIERSGSADFVKLDAVILKACQPEVSQRYQTTNEMLHDLRAATQSSDMTARPQ